MELPVPLHMRMYSYQKSKRNSSIVYLKKGINHCVPVFHRSYFLYFYGMNYL